MKRNERVFETKSQVAAHRVARFLSYTLNRSFQVQQTNRELYTLTPNRQDMPQKELSAIRDLAKAFWRCVKLHDAQSRAGISG